MQLKLSSKDAFLNTYISLLSRVADSAVINVSKGKLHCLIATSDNTIVVSGDYNDNLIDLEKVLNIPDLKKLYRVLSCIETEDLTLDVALNHIGYSNSNIRFKYHLYDDNIISTPKLNISKLDSLEFDGKFTLPYSSIINLIKGSSITTESNKIYLSVKNNIVFGELTDKTRPNIDSYGIQISDNYSGTQFAIPLPLNFEIFRIISSMRCKELNVNLVTKMGVVVMDLSFEKTQFKFVISALSN